ncbi:MAG: alpha-L-fucosidase [Bacteroidales bacterium]|nr:alpha-L-fucosidase [Bacteroidales bacterium]
MKKISLLLLTMMLAPQIILADINTTEQMPETDAAICRRIEQWQDLKFGFMVHWGIYAQWGVVESWSICNEPWISRNGADYSDYKQRYQALNKTFNPKQFDAKKWAQIAYDAGMKYMIFTTKHHDGYCLFDSHETTYTSAQSPCHRDFVREITDAFRAKGLWTGLYFSKADWHHDDYWAHEWATPDRNVNYDPAQHSERWQRFVEFTHNQIRELTHNYGDIDILWLDGGWCRPEWSIDDEVRPWLGCQGWIQDIDMTRLANIARENNHDMLIVDRTVHGRYENYRTPEREVPGELLPYPWETCMTMGDSWSYVPNDNYKSTRTLIHMLCDIVAKGGCLLLNVGPDADGQIPDIAQQRLKEIGQWLNTNGKAIYATQPLFPFTHDNWRLTQSKDGNTAYFIYLVPENAKGTLTVTLPTVEGFEGGKEKITNAEQKIAVVVERQRVAR